MWLVFESSVSGHVEAINLSRVSGITLAVNNVYFDYIEDEMLSHHPIQDFLTARLVTDSELVSGLVARAKVQANESVERTDNPAGG